MISQSKGRKSLAEAPPTLASKLIVGVFSQKELAYELKLSTPNMCGKLRGNLKLKREEAEFLASKVGLPLGTLFFNVYTRQGVRFIAVPNAN